MVGIIAHYGNRQLRFDPYILLIHFRNGYIELTVKAGKQRLEAMALLLKGGATRQLNMYKKQTN